MQKHFKQRDRGGTDRPGASDLDLLPALRQSKKKAAFSFLSVEAAKIQSRRFIVGKNRRTSKGNGRIRANASK